MSVKSKHSYISTSKKSGKKGKKKKESDDEFESSEEELDLTKECHPIGYYINDRAEMINQMFSVIKGNKLKAMLPPCLKECDIDQIKLQCLDQLLGMSEKRITCILQGETLDASSESEVGESDELDSDEKNQTDSSSSTEKSRYSKEDGYTNDVNHRQKKRKGGSVSGGKPRKTAKSDSECAQPEEGKTLLEILELEMRARAIRALLKQSGNDTKGGDADKNGEVVDLTEECEDEEFPTVVKKEKTPETEVDLKVSTFEEKVEKTKKEKTNSSQEEEKSKKLQAEFELRNKLFKKKIYRTRQQRMENEEECKNAEENKDEIEKDKERESRSDGGVNDIVIKQEPMESEEIVIEDPEEGEIDTSEDEYPVEIKQEPEEEALVPEAEITDELVCPEPEDFEAKLDEDAEMVTAIDNGTFVSSCNFDSEMDSTQKKEEPCVESKEEEEVMESGECDKVKSQDNRSCDVVSSATESKESEKDKGVVDELNEIEGETSWRDRWLQKGEVQKLVKSSKIFAKVKKRIVEKSHRAKEEHSNSLETNSESTSNCKEEVIVGSIKEYERLLGKTSESPSEGDLGEGDNSQESTDDTKSTADEKT